MTFERNVTNPNFVTIVRNRGICRYEIVMEQLHIVLTVHNWCIRQPDDLAWAWNLGLNKLLPRMLEYIWISAEHFRVLSHSSLALDSLPTPTPVAICT